MSEEIVERLRRAIAEQDPVPDAVVAAARASLTWLTIDAELARLVEDSSMAAAGIRAIAQPVILTFDSGSVIVTLEITSEDDLRQITGHTDGGFASLLVRHRDGEQPSEVDAHGRFRVDRVPAGPVSLVFRSADQSVRPFTTEWVNI
jgi:hypothetical protein